MKKYVFIALAIMLGTYFLGCGKKQQPLEEMQEPMSIESLGTLSTETKADPSKVAETQASSVDVLSASKLESLPPSGPYNPSATEIQTALKAAGFYTGAIDGKIGPMSKKSIEEFQKMKNLKVDGKVGPKTWQALEQYLVKPQVR